MLRFTLFVYLTTFKVSVFRFITAYNANFQITLDKLAKTRNTLLSNFQLVVYLYGIKDTYPDFAASQQSAAQANVPNISAVMAELEDKAQSLNKPTVLPVCSLNASRRRSYDRGDRNTRN